MGVILLVCCLCSCLRNKGFLFGFRDVSKGGPGAVVSQGEGSQHSLPGVLLLHWGVDGTRVGGFKPLITSSLECQQKPE